MCTKDFLRCKVPHKEMGCTYKNNIKNTIVEMYLQYLSKFDRVR